MNFLNLKYITGPSPAELISDFLICLQHKCHPIDVDIIGNLLKYLMPSNYIIKLKIELLSIVIILGCVVSMKYLSFSWLKPFSESRANWWFLADVILYRYFYDSKAKTFTSGSLLSSMSSVYRSSRVSADVILDFMRDEFFTWKEISIFYY